MLPIPPTFALLDGAVQLQLSYRKASCSVSHLFLSFTNDLHASIAASHHENVIFRVLTLMLLLGGAVCVRCVCNVSVGVHCVGLDVGVRMSR